MASEFKSAMTTRSLRMVRTELEFLADASVITPQLLSYILSELPGESDVRSLGQQQQPTPSPQPVPVQTQPPPAPYSPPAPEPVTAPINEKLPIHNQYAPPPVQSPPAYNQVPPATTFAEALYDFQPTASGDLAISQGNRIQVLEQMNNDWWHGRNESTGALGMFPRSYVRILDEKAPIASPPPTNYGNMPLEVSQGGPSATPNPSDPNKPNKFEQGGKKFGKKLGNAAIFGAGATVGSNIVNSIF